MSLKNGVLHLLGQGGADSVQSTPPVSLWVKQIKAT